MMLSFTRYILLGSLLLCGLMAHAKSNEQSLDNIVAVVNDTVITQTELNQALRMAKNQMAAENITPPPIQTLRKQILEHLINNKVQLEAAEQMGIHVNDMELDKFISQIATENHISVDEFYKKIAQEGFSVKAYRKQIRESITLQRLQQQQVASRITVAPDEISDFLRSANQQASGDKEYHLQDILIPVSDSPSPQEIAISKKFAKDLMGKLQKGVHLKDLATAETESLQDNDLSWRKLAEVPTAFTEPVVHMKTNDFTGPIQTSNGFHIIHLIAQRNAATHAQKPPRQEVAQLIFQRKFEEALQGWLAKIRGQAFIVIQDKAIA